MIQNTSDLARESNPHAGFVWEDPTDTGLCTSASRDAAREEAVAAHSASAQQKELLGEPVALFSGFFLDPKHKKLCWNSAEAFGDKTVCKKGAFGGVSHGQLCHPVYTVKGLSSPSVIHGKDDRYKLRDRFGTAALLNAATAWLLPWTQPAAPRVSVGRTGACVVSGTCPHPSAGHSAKILELTLNEQEYLRGESQEVGRYAGCQRKHRCLSPAVWFFSEILLNRALDNKY